MKLNEIRIYLIGVNHEKKVLIDYRYWLKISTSSIPNDKYLRAVLAEVGSSINLRTMYLYISLILYLGLFYCDWGVTSILRKKYICSKFFLARPSILDKKYKLF